MGDCGRGILLKQTCVALEAQESACKSQHFSYYSFRGLSVHTDGKTDGQSGGHVWIDSASDPDQEYIYFIASKTLPSTCYVLSDKSNIPFYSTSNGYNNNKKILPLFFFHNLFY